MKVELKRHDEIAVITLDRPEALNALNAGMLSLLSMAINEVERSDARAVIITGAGPKAFCAGADIAELAQLNTNAKKQKSQFGQSIFGRLDALRMPSIALINGYAFGGGFELALSTTFRLATPKAAVALPEVKLGLIPGYGGTQRLPRLIGETRALEMIMSGRTVRAEEAFRIGLVSRLLDDENSLDQAIAFAREFTRHSLVTLQHAKNAVRQGLSASLAEGLEIEAELSVLAFTSEDAKEGITAFMEKRAPSFKDA